jgi:hypothetical protein
MGSGKGEIKMNKLGWTVAFLLFVLLLAVVAGFEQVRGGLLVNQQNLMKERGEVITLVEEATTQRNGVMAERDNLERKVAALEEEKKVVNLKLDEALSVNHLREEEIWALRNENINLQRTIGELKVELAKLPPLPVTGDGQKPGGGAFAVQPPSVQHAAVEETAKVGAGTKLQKQAVTAAVMFMGFVALSSGGIAAYVLDPKRNGAVRQQ